MVLGVALPKVRPGLLLTGFGWLNEPGAHRATRHATICRNGSRLPCRHWALVLCGAGAPPAWGTGVGAGSQLRHTGDPEETPSP